MKNQLKTISRNQAEKTAEAPTTHPIAVLPPPVSERSYPNFNYDFTQVPTHLARDTGEVGASTMPNVMQPALGTIDLLSRAASEQSHPFEPAIKKHLEQHLKHDLSNVRIRQGPASNRAAERLGARAYTLGNSIYLGSEVSSLNRRDKTNLMAHEAVHTVQQGSVTASPHSGLTVSSPNDASEIEAKHIADSLDASNVAPTSRSLSLRASMRANSGRPGIARMVTPQVQRDLTGKHPVRDGEFNLNLKTESHAGAKNGMSGTIKFKASNKAPDSTKIRLLQTYKLVDLGTGKDYVWTGGNANRNKIRTSADKASGVEEGWGVDMNPAGIAPRSAKGDSAISPYYRDYWPNAASSQDGSKKGKTVNEASLWDYPGWSSNSQFSFETVAKATDTGHVYGTVMWGFTISDASKGKVEKERAVGRNVTLLTTDKAIENFNEFFKNPGSSTAP